MSPRARSFLTIVDDLGRSVTIATFPPRRIVCLGPSLTETVYALGLGNNVVGVDAYSDYPPGVVSKRKVRDCWRPDPDEVSSLNPDVVLMNSRIGPGDPYVKRLEENGLTVVAFRPYTVNDILRDIMLVGEVTGASKKAEQVVLAMLRRFSEVTGRTRKTFRKPRVYVEIWYPPPWTWAAKSWVHELIEMAGGVNAFGDLNAHWIAVADAEVAERRPEVIVVCHARKGRMPSFEEIKARNGWGAIPAVAEGKVYSLEHERPLNYAGPSIADGLLILARLLHPELFDGDMG